jgi:UDP-3-O-[3-hydroxymyristoyl] glucosamine N-acyltransferase
MRFTHPQKLSDLAQRIGAKIIGDENQLVYGINEINVIQEGEIVFVDHPKYYQKALTSNASVVIMNAEADCPKGKALLLCDNPFSAFNQLTAHFSPRTFSTSAISKTASIAASTRIMPNCFIGDGVVIGENCILHANVCIHDNCIIGNNVIIHSGSIIGTDAFYYKKRPAGYEKLISVGKVIIEDHVEIGALSSVDRGVTGETVIGAGTKIDNHVQIGHDTKVGRNCLFASQVGISGACVIEDDVILWGQVGVPSKIRIGKGAVLLGQSAPAKNIEGGKTYLGSPAEESMKKFRELAAIRKLPEILMKL